MKLTSKKIFSVLLAAAFMLGLFPFEPFAPRTAKVANPLTINLNSVLADSSAGYYDYNSATGLITVDSTHAPLGDTVTITGDGTNGGAGYSIIIDEALTINIAVNTTILGAVDIPALTVPGGAKITGQGAGISITGNPASAIDRAGGIYVNTGGLTIDGELGDITSSISEGIYVLDGDLTISATATVGNITGSSTTGGNLTIDGTVGRIRAFKLIAQKMVK